MLIQCKNHITHVLSDIIIHLLTGHPVHTENTKPEVTQYGPNKWSPCGVTYGLLFTLWYTD